MHLIEIGFLCVGAVAEAVIIIPQPHRLGRHLERADEMRDGLGDVIK